MRLDVRRLLAQILRSEESTEAIVADLGTKNQFYFNAELGQWVGRGEEHLVQPKQPLPPPPIKRDTQEANTDSTEPANHLDALMRPPQYSAGRSLRGVKVRGSCVAENAETEQGRREQVLPGGSPEFCPSDTGCPGEELGGTPESRLVNLCGEAAATRRRAIMARHAHAVRVSRQQAWDACLLRGLQQRACASVTYKREELHSALRFLEQHQDLEQQTLLTQLRMLWAATFEVAAASEFVAQNGLPVLLAVLHRHSGQDVKVQDVEVQIAGCGILRNIVEDGTMRANVVGTGGLTYLVEAMQQHSQACELLQLGWQTLFFLALSAEFKSDVSATGVHAQAEKIVSQMLAVPSDGQPAKSMSEAARWGWKLQEVLDYGVSESVWN